MKKNLVLSAKKLEREAILNKLSYFLESFKTNELSQETIDIEVEAVRQELYEKSKLNKVTPPLLS